MTGKAPAYDALSSIKTSFASISLHQTDRLRLLQFPPNEIACIRNFIKQNWPKGIQEERPYAKSHEFKFPGNPWSGADTTAIAAGVLIMRELFAHLFAHGWILTASTDVMTSVYTKDTMIFRQQAATPPVS